MKSLSLLLAAAAALAVPAAAADLPRRAFLGIAMAPDAQTGAGAAISDIVPGGTAGSIGLRTGDVIVAAGGQPIAGPADIAAYAGRLTAGAPVALTVRRDGRELRLQGAAAGRPLERYEGARVDYGAVPFQDGLLRDIMVSPEGVAAPPVVFLIQGFTCVSVEAQAPGETNRRLGEEFVRAGIAYYRVEKPGMGDSAGGPHCTQIDYETELAAFRAAYNHLIASRSVAPERIFMLGHSLGGLQAPMLAAERAPRGVAVYGTVLRNWADYHRNISQFQPWLLQGQDAVAATQGAERYRDAFRRFYIERESPAAIAASDPALAEGLREAFAWDGGDRMFGRHFKYAQDLAHQPLFAAWRDAKTNVLSLYGGSDMVALFDTDHKLIADLVNLYRPGTATYVELPGTGHDMETIGSRLAVRQAYQTGNPPEGAFNPAAAEAIVAWVRRSMASAPVG